MIDEKKTEEAAKKYAVYPITDGIGYERIISFKDGINWFKENLWHDASEEPKDKSKEILYKSNFYEGHGTTSSKYSVIYEKEPWRHTVSRLGVEKWLYIDDLQKGGE